MGFRTGEPQALCRRPEITEVLHKRLTAFTQGYRQNIALIGYPGVGKTTLIFDILRAYSGRHLIPLYLEVPARGWERFVRTCAGTVLFQCLTREESPAGDLGGLLEQAKKRLPRTAKAILALIKMADSGEALPAWPQLLTVIQIAAEETKTPVLLVCDEFQQLEQIGFPEPFGELSNKIMVHKNIMHLLISSTPFAAEAILKEKLSLLFGNFECIRVHPLRAETAREFIRQRLAPVTVTKPIDDFLAHITGGYPLYLDVLTDQLRSVTLNASTQSVTKPQLLAALIEVLAKEHGIINQHFAHRFNDAFLNGESGQGITVLLAIATGSRKLSAIAAAIHTPVSEIGRLLHRLIATDVVRKKGVFLEITDPLLSFWLRLVVQRKRNSFDAARFSTGEVFERDLSEYYEAFAAETQKDVGQRVKELFALFSNDIVALDSRRFMLSRFDSLKLTAGNGLICLDARREKTRWHCYIAQQPVTEGSINDALAAGKGDRRSRRILVALAGIEDNARLKALEARFWIWDRTTVDELLMLFQKPQVLL